MNQVYDYITEAIIAQLEKGNIPWKKTWNGGKEGAPTNLVSKKQYQGINSFLLAFTPYASPYWMTFKQCSGLGGTVKKGAKSTMVVFWKPFIGKDKSGEEKKSFMLRYYNIFNAEQCEGLTYPKLETKEFNRIEACEKFVSNMPNKPSIVHGNPQACYSPMFDTVNMPNANMFTSPEYYYSVLFHELAHSTGHVSRLKRDGVTEGARFGSETYSKEELVAEMTSTFLCSETGILPSVITNSAAYIQGWLKRLKEDKTLLVGAASQATKATKYILGELEAKIDKEESD